MSGAIETIGESLRDLLVPCAERVYFGDPGLEGLDALPAIVVGVPSGERREVDAAEDHIGQKDWHLEYPFTVLCDLGKAADSQMFVVAALQSMIDTIDDGLGDLDGSVLDAVVSQWDQPDVISTQPRALLTISGTIQVLAFT